MGTRRTVRFLTLFSCLLALAGWTVTPSRADFNILSNSTVEEGYNSYSNLIPDVYGNLYGTSYSGGDYGKGNIFMLDADGTRYELYAFTGGVDGAYPTCTLSIDTFGNLYGTASQGGASGNGTVFKLSIGNVLVVLKSFAGGIEGAYPSGGVVRDNNGNLYGTTLSGGTSAYGTLYKLTPGGVHSVLASFNGTNGAYPQFASLVRDSSGNLYGTAAYGGINSFGTVFKYTTSTATLSTLKQFTGGADGSNPLGGLVRDGSGNLYGMTNTGGSTSNGVIFKISASGTYSKLFDFSGPDGSSPTATFIRDATGNLYGSTIYGGTGSCGVVFRFNPISRQYLVLRNFSGNDGSAPYGGIYRASNGVITGLTGLGGANGYGVAYQITYPYLVNLADFNVATTGKEPRAGLIKDASGTYYGTTSIGGANGRGTVYKFKPGVGITVLHSFSPANGGYPMGALIRDGSGNLYGICANSGGFDSGSVWKLSPTGVFTKLHDFTGTDGAYPNAGLIRDNTTGFLYGTTSSGGASNQGTVYRISPSGAFTTLFHFNNTTSGQQPLGTLIRDSAGNLYGTCAAGGSFLYGTVWKLSASNVFTVLKNFAVDSSDGALPQGNLVRDSGGNLYGTTTQGGIDNNGVIFRIDANGKYFVLYRFNAIDGATPRNILRDSTGNLYGATPEGRGGAKSVVYRLSGSNVMTTLGRFALSQAGYTIWESWSNLAPGILLRDSTTGNLLGVNVGGGANNNGTIYGLFY